jgi:hypothetical protein
VFIQALHCPAVSHFKKSGKPSPVTSTIRTPLSILLEPWINTGTGWKRDDAYKPQTAIAGNYSGVVKDYGVRIVDVNGNTHTIVNIISATHISNDHWWFPIIIALPT